MSRRCLSLPVAASVLAAFSLLGGRLGDRPLREPQVLAMAVAIIASYTWVLWAGGYLRLPPQRQPERDRYGDERFEEDQDQ